MQCESGNPVLDVVLGFFSFLGDPVGTILNVIAKAVLAAAIAVFGALSTSVPTMSGTTTSKQINGQSQWLVVYLAVGSLLFAAARMAVERRGAAGVTALKGILRVIIVSGAATTVVMAAARISDDYSDHLFREGALRQLQDVGGCSTGDGIQAVLLLVLAFLLLLSGIIHTILLYIRLGVMIILLGTLPLAAAASMTDWGAGWWRKHIGWMIAWLLYKPAAALVLYAGSAMTSSDEASGSQISERIAGIGVMLLSAVALPALLKLVVPATAALGGGSAVSGAMSQVGKTLASGARSIGGGDGGSDEEKHGRSGPSGASGADGNGGDGGRSGADGASGSAGASRSSSGPGSDGAWAGASGSSSDGGSSQSGAASSSPAGMAVTAAIAAAQIAGKAVSGSLDQADGDRGHNR